MKGAGMFYGFNLPFTGINLIVTAGVGAATLATGLWLRLRG